MQELVGLLIGIMTALGSAAILLGMFEVTFLRRRLPTSGARKSIRETAR